MPQASIFGDDEDQFIDDSRSLSLPFREFAEDFDLNGDGVFGIAESVYVAAFIFTGSQSIAESSYNQAQSDVGIEVAFEENCRGRTGQEFGPDQNLSYFQFLDWSLNNPFSYVEHIITGDFLDPVCG